MKNKSLKALTIVLFAALLCGTLAFAACGGNSGHKVEFDVNGGEKLSPVYSIDEIELPVAVREGYTFNGWYAELDGEGNPAGEKLSGRYKVTAPVTLHAAWLPYSLAEVFDGYELVKAVNGLSELTVEGEHNGVKITSVADSAFEGITALTAVTLPSEVARIGAAAFRGCASLKSISTGINVSEIRNNTFEGCASLQSADIPSVVRIGAAAFRGCGNLTSLTAANSAVEVEANSFEGCAKLITEQGGVKYINNCAVGLADGVTAVTLKQGTAAVWSYAFAASKIVSADLGGAEYIGSFAFGDCAQLTSVNLGDKLKHIGSNAFYNCASLGSPVLPQTLVSIGSAAFYGCEAIASVAIPFNVAGVGANAYKNCTSLTALNLGGCTEIGSGAFENCAQLGGADLQHIEVIGSNAFRGCANISAVNLSALRVLHSEAFSGTGVASVSLPQTVTEIGNGAFKDCASLNSVTFAEGLEVVGASAFENCALLTSADLPQSVKTVNGRAFYNCGLTEANLGAEVAYIGADAFGGCNLTRVNYGGKLIDWARINFEENSNPVTIAHNLYVNNAAVTEIVLLSADTDVINKVAEYAFDGLGNISKLVLDESITEIGDNAFRGCTVAETYYTGDSYGWMYVMKGEGNPFGEEYTSVWYYSETQPTDAENKYWHYTDDVITKW